MRCARGKTTLLLAAQRTSGIWYSPPLAPRTCAMLHVAVRVQPASGRETPEGLQAEVLLLSWSDLVVTAAPRRAAQLSHPGGAQKITKGEKRNQFSADFEEVSVLPLQNPLVVKTPYGRSGCDGVAKGIKNPWEILWYSCHHTWGWCSCAWAKP